MFIICRTFLSTDDANVIRLGLSNIGCEMMCDAFKNELPVAVTSMLQAHTRGIDLFISQFPDWNRFVENAAATQLATTDVDDLRDAAAKLIVRLQNEPDLVEPEVPKTLSRLNELLTKPSSSAKRAAFAMLRSIENLVSKVFSYGAEFLDQTMSKTIAGASSITSKVLMAGLLSVALSGAVTISPVAAKVSEMQWLKKAVQLVEEQLGTLKA